MCGLYTVGQTSQLGMKVLQSQLIIILGVSFGLKIHFSDQEARVEGELADGPQRKEDVRELENNHGDHLYWNM